MSLLNTYSNLIRILKTGPAPGEVRSALIHPQQNLARDGSKSHFTVAFFFFAYLDFQLLHSFFLFSTTAEILSMFHFYLVQEHSTCPHKICEPNTMICMRDIQTDSSLLTHSLSIQYS